MALEAAGLLRSLVELLVDRPADLAVDYKLLPAGRVEFSVMPNINDQGKAVGKNGAHVKALKFLMAVIGEGVGLQFVLRLEQDDDGRREEPIYQASVGNAARYISVLRQLIDATFASEVEVRMIIQPTNDLKTEYVFALYPMDGADYEKLTAIRAAGEFQGQSVALAFRTLFRAAGLRDGTDCRIEVPAR